MSPDFIYTMKDLRKVVPPKREILKGIWLSFYYGAKIGVLGLNGAGKSSLLRIMAGQDPDFIGEAFLGFNAREGAAIELAGRRQRQRFEARPGCGHHRIRQAGGQEAPEICERRRRDPVAEHDVGHEPASARGLAADRDGSLLHGRVTGESGLDLK